MRYFEKSCKFLLNNKHASWLSVKLPHLTVESSTNLKTAQAKLLSELGIPPAAKKSTPKAFAAGSGLDAARTGRNDVAVYSTQGGLHGRQAGQIWGGSFSAVSTPIFSSKYAFVTCQHLMRSTRSTAIAPLHNETFQQHVEFFKMVLAGRQAENAMISRPFE